MLEVIGIMLKTYFRFGFRNESPVRDSLGSWNLGPKDEKLDGFSSMDPPLKLTGPAVTRFTPQPINDALR